MDKRLTVMCGDALEKLRELPDGCVQTCITSSPYFSLRSYLPKDYPDKAREIGTEKSPEAYVERLVEVFREVCRVLKNDGTLWLNLGDSYASVEVGRHDARTERAKEFGCVQMQGPRERAKLKTGLPAKNLLGIPWRVAFALQADGWILRSDVIWEKPNCMPESVRDRPTRSHEYLFLLSKRARYYYDHRAVMESCVKPPRRRVSGVDEPKRHGINGARASGVIQIGNSTLKNKRSVWTCNTRGFKGAHFATFPEALITPCILAGSRPGDLVLDPFAGSGTTLKVALDHGRRGIGIELNPDYIPLIYERTNVTPPLDLNVKVAA
jgi:DNA modification methylase